MAARKDNGPSAKQPGNNGSNGRRGINPRTGKPMPQGKRFQKGQSGNPAGRKPNEQVLSIMLREVLAEIDPKTSKSNAHAVAKALVEAAKKGSVSAAALIYERIEGKVTQPLSGPDGGPIQHEFADQPDDAIIREAEALVRRAFEAAQSD